MMMTLIVNDIRDFKIQRRGRQRERQKNNRFNKQNNNDVKMPNLAFYGGRKQATTKFYFSFWAWIWSFEI